jgi:small subunit ribosomal protein S6
VSHWGKRTLAYRLKKKETGYYVVAQYEAAPELLTEYERAVTLDEAVLRFLVVLAAPEVVRPVAVAPTTVAATDEDVDEEDV